jgi:hypothetical protein
MDAVAAAPSWTDARAKLVRRERKQRVADIFQGTASWERASIAGIEVLRLSVSPAKDKPVPASYAVLDAHDWATMSAPQTLPFKLQWQQSMPGRFDFYFDMPKDARCLGLG